MGSLSLSIGARWMCIPGTDARPCKYPMPVSLAVGSCCGRTEGLLTLRDDADPKATTPGSERLGYDIGKRAM